jgi:hypothetical protein
MSGGIRIFRNMLLGLSAVVGIIIVLLMVLPIIDDVRAAPPDTRDPVVDAAPQNPTVSLARLDSSIDTILKRPLFAANRRPPVPKQTAENPDAVTPPPLPERLAGVMLGPHGREALFGNPGGKPTAVGVGGTIGGWTVSVIELDRVVLTGAFGERVLEPSEGDQSDARSSAPAPRVPAFNVGGAPTVQPAHPPIATVPQYRQQRVLLAPSRPTAAKPGS